MKKSFVFFMENVLLYIAVIVLIDSISGSCTVLKVNKNICY